MTEHGIAFGVPHVMGSQTLAVTRPTKNRFENGGQNYSASTYEVDEILIPIAVVNGAVFCFSLINRQTREETQWRNPQYAGGMPTAFYIQEVERLCYFAMPPVMDFIRNWKPVT